MVWYWEDTPYSLESIKAGDFIATDEFMQAAWGFVQSWLSGASEFYLMTSGSTGAPKEIRLTRAQMQASARGTAKALGLTSYSSALLALNPQYIGGKMMLVRALEYGLTLVGIPPTGDPFAYLAGKGHLRFFDLIALVPAQMHNLIQNPTNLAYLNGSKAIILGGGAVSESLLEAIESIDAPIYNSYGMTETVSHIALKRLNGAGKVDYFQALTGVELETDERNCLRIRAEVTGFEWIQTNDIVHLLDNQRFVWQGRADNILNTGGLKIQIEALEAKIAPLLKLQNIEADFAVVGAPDDKWQQRIRLYLEIPTLPAHRATELLQYLKNALLPHEAPKEIVCKPAFPRTETGKLKRGNL